MKVLVTGGTGFIGGFLVNRLVEEGHDVKVLVRKTSNMRYIKNINIKKVCPIIVPHTFKGNLSSILASL